MEQIGLFIGAFGRAEASNGVAAFVAKPRQAVGGRIKRLVPARLAEMGLPIARVDIEALRGCIFAPDQRFGQAMRMVDIVEAEPAFDAETPFICGAIDALDIFHLAVFDLQRHLTSDTAEGANALDLFVEIRPVADLVFIDNARRHQRASGAGLHTFATCHAGALPHRVVEIKDRIAVLPPACHADHVIDLHLAAGPNAEAALDARVQIDRHRHMAVIQKRDAPLFELGEAALVNAVQLGHVPEMGGFVMRHIALRLISKEHFDDQFPSIFGAARLGDDNHPLDRFADAGGGQSPLALDLHHTGAAIAIGAVPGRGFVTQMRDHQATAIGHFPDGFSGLRLDFLAIQREADHVTHTRISLSRDTLSQIPAPDSPSSRPG